MNKRKKGAIAAKSNKAPIVHKDEQLGNEETTAEGVLDAFLPGIGKIFSNLKNTSPAFKQRLEETDKEIERRIAAGGSSRSVRTSFSSPIVRSNRTMDHKSDCRFVGLDKHNSSRRPVIDYNVRVRTLAPEHDTTTSFKPLMKKATESKVISKPKPRSADIFDEKDKIVLVIELPGVKKEDIKVKASGNIVEISAGEYNETIKLPSEVSGKPVIKFKNGILELRLAKKGK